jgi:DNA-directed RNA polymerase subunit F
MSRAKVISETPVTMAEVKFELEGIKGRDKELNFRSQRTDEYLNIFVKIDTKKAEDLKKKLEKLSIPRMGAEHIVKIVDLLPKTVEELKIILQGYPLTITKENMQKIVDVVKDYI